MPNEAQLSVPYQAVRTLANLANNVSVELDISADAAASTTTAETLLGRVYVAGTITAVKVTGATAITASDSVYATITVYARDTNGANQVTVATLTTKITGGSGNWTAFKPVDFGAITNGTVGAGWVLTYAVAKASTGTQLPLMHIQAILSAN